MCQSCQYILDFSVSDDIIIGFTLNAIIRQLIVVGKTLGPDADDFSLIPGQNRINYNNKYSKQVVGHVEVSQPR